MMLTREPISQMVVSKTRDLMLLGGEIKKRKEATYIVLLLN